MSRHHNVRDSRGLRGLLADMRGMAAHPPVEEEADPREERRDRRRDKRARKARERVTQAERYEAW